MWDKSSSTPKNAGLVELGFGFYHTGVELWGKEISFGHSRKYVSGIFAVRPRSADTLMSQTRFREAIDVSTVYISRYRSLSLFGAAAPAALVLEDLTRFHPCRTAWTRFSTGWL